MQKILFLEFEFVLWHNTGVVWAYRGIFYKDKIFLCFVVKFLRFALYLIPLYIFVILIINDGNYKIKV